MKYSVIFDRWALYSDGISLDHKLQNSRAEALMVIEGQATIVQVEKGAEEVWQNHLECKERNIGWEEKAENSFKLKI